jgi:hypothetical protein
VFLNSGDDKKALVAFKSAGNWRMTFMVAAKLKFSERELNDLAHDMAETLKSSGNWLDASLVLAEYTQDKEKVVDTLLAGNEWAEAIRRVCLLLFSCVVECLILLVSVLCYSVLFTARVNGSIPKFGQLCWRPLRNFSQTFKRSSTNGRRITLDWGLFV